MKQCLSSVHISFINNSLINLDQREKKRHQNQQLKVITAQEQSCAYFAPLAASFVSATCNTPAREHWSSVFVHWLKKTPKSSFLLHGNVLPGKSSDIEQKWHRVSGGGV